MCIFGLEVVNSVENDPLQCTGNIFIFILHPQFINIYILFVVKLITKGQHSFCKLNQWFMLRTLANRLLTSFQSTPLY